MSYSGTQTIAELADALARQGTSRPMQAPDLIGRAGKSAADSASMPSAEGIMSAFKTGKAANTGIGNLMDGYKWDGTPSASMMADLSGQATANVGAGMAGFAGGGEVGQLPRPHHVGQRGGISHFSRPAGGLARGLIHSDTPGRADHVPARVRRGAYVVPADVVSGIGQGNTMAGANALKQALGSHGPLRLADGGVAGDAMDVRLSGGEYVLDPEEVAAIGRGNHGAGAEVLDGLVHAVRTHAVKTMRELPPPK
jgi:hypothetical protein